MQKENIFVIAEIRRKQLLQTIEEVAFKVNPCAEIKKEMENLKKVPLVNFLTKEEIDFLLSKCFPFKIGQPSKENTLGHRSKNFARKLETPDLIISKDNTKILECF